MEETVEVKEYWRKIDGEMQLVRKCWVDEKGDEYELPIIKQTLQVYDQKTTK